MKKAKSRINVRSLTLLALMTALVVLVEILSSNIKFGPFSITFTHIPIVIGAAMLGPLAGAWLGLTMGVVVLFEPATMPFLIVNFLATVFVVILKSALAGFASGLVYKFIKQKTLGISIAALTCPIVNTGIFIIGSLIFFMPTIASWQLPGDHRSTFAYLILGVIGMNFVFEFIVAAVLIPLIKKIIEIVRKVRGDKSYI